MIGITFALPAESSGLRRRISTLHRDGDLFWGEIDHHAVALVHTGVGAKNCNALLEVLLHRMRPQLIISSGFAGAVRSGLSVEDLILANNFSDPKLLAGAARILGERQPQVVKLFTATSIIDSMAERAEIARASGASAVDMETGAIANVCRAHGVPLLSLRAITDTPSQPFPAPMSVLFDITRQRTNYGKLFAYLLREPASISGLIRFSKQIARVRDTLTDAIVGLVREL
jgi:adenosylhomocysteine nucleosidase